MKRTNSPKELLRLLGSFWSEIFSDHACLLSLCRGRLQLAQEEDIEIDYLINAIGRHTLKPYRSRQWTEIRLKLSERNREVRPIYGEGFIYDSTITYAGVSPASYHSWPLPKECNRGCPIICNRILDASAVLVNGIDFSIDKNALLFTRDPFTDPRFEAYDGPDGPEIRLWGWQCEYDKDDLYRQWGYILDRRFGEGELAKAATNAVYDSLIGGSTKIAALSLISSVCGVPFAEGNETVEQIINDNNYLWIITDKNSYKFNANNSPLVSINEKINTGQSLVDAVQITELPQPQSPLSEEKPEWLKSITLGRGFCGDLFGGEITFRDETVYTRITQDNGYTRIEWDLHGDQEAIKKFWDEVHRRGVTAGKTLAHFLDTRENPQGEPTKENLPATINPLLFLIKNLFYANLWIIRVRPAGFSKNAAGIAALNSILRSIIPPHTTCLIMIVLDNFVTSLEFNPNTNDDISRFTFLKLTDTLNIPAFSDKISCTHGTVC